ncbi:MAG: glycosyltransferase family 4 protein [Spirochaetales bacterium]|nr:glycosyltransferase family 4 protein [Spirochaetales bacterium]
MSLLILYPEFSGIGGIARYIDNFFLHLPSDFEKVYLLTGDEGLETKQYRNVSIISIPLKRSKLGLLKWSIEARKIIKKLYKSETIRACNIHIPPLIPGLFIPDIPIIVTAHTTYLGLTGKFYNKKYYTSQYHFLSFIIKYIMEKIIIHRSWKIIVLTEQGKMELLRYSTKKEMSIIPNGVDPDIFIPDPETQKIYDVIFSGRIEKRKGSDSLIDVCRELVKQKPGIKICILGYGDDFEKVRTRLHPYKNSVFFTGKIPLDEVISFYRKSKVYASTAYYEGLPGTCLEAMSLELPAVTWDFLFYKGLVENEKTGLLAEPNNTGEMSKKIIYLLDNVDVRTDLGKKARQRVQLNYNWKNLTDKIRKCYEQ